MSWTPEQLALVDAARELEIAVRRVDGTLRPWTPIWVVHVVGDVYVRTWYRRDTGWFGLALSTRCARARIPGVEVDVRIEDVGVGPVGTAGGRGRRLPRQVRRRFERKHGRRRSRSDNASVAQRMIGRDEIALNATADGDVVEFRFNV
jgi:hypothetical protein